MATRFHVRFVRPNGWAYDIWPSAENEAEAVRAADALLEYRERVGIGDYLDGDGLTVRDPAQLVVTPTADAPASELALRCTQPDGTVARES